ncbi:MAG TPA: hypothetical protein VNN76_07185 [Bacteroidota bacterium]|nr:hypothetical protein [Bacteroidota bacterium]
MSLGQTMLSAAFIVVLTVAVVNANRVIVESETETYRGEAIELGTRFAQALLIEASRKKFDHNQIDSVYQDPSAFTTPSSLGPNTGEVVSPLPDQAPFKAAAVYNDVDDYHGYQRRIDTGRIKGLLLQVEVYYVSKSYPNSKSSSKTYLKRIDVSLSHAVHIQKPMKFSAIVTY